MVKKLKLCNFKETKIKRKGTIVVSLGCYLQAVKGLSNKENLKVIIENLDSEFESLQDSFANIDLLSENTNGKKLLLEVRLKKILPLDFRMEPDTHKKPHLHISYGKKKHAASYSLLDGEPIVGNIPSKYDKVIKEWIDSNKEVLIKIWDELKKGNQSEYESLIKSL